MDRMKKRSAPAFLLADSRRDGDSNEVNKENNDNNNKPVQGSPPSLEWLQKTFLRSQSENFTSSRHPAGTKRVQVTDCNYYDGAAGQHRICNTIVGMG